MLKQQRFIAQCSSYQKVHDLGSSRFILQWGHFPWFVDRILSLDQLLFFLSVRTLIWFMRAPPSWPNYPPKVPHPNVIPLGVRMSTYEFWEDTNIQSIIAPSVSSSKCLLSVLCTGQIFSLSYHLFWLFCYAILRKIDVLHFNAVEFWLFFLVYYFCVLLTKSIHILMLKIISYFLQKSWNIVTLLRIFIINECWILLKAFAASTKIII